MRASSLEDDAAVTPGRVLPDFTRTDIAFAYLSNQGLWRAFLLFKSFAYQGLVQFGSQMMQTALSWHLPVSGIIRHTVYKQFCGGETAEQCLGIVRKLGSYSVKTILDYAVEACTHEDDLNAAASEIERTIIFSGQDARIPFAVFKMTAVARFELLEKMAGRKKLSAEGEQEKSRLLQRVTKLCQKAADLKVPLLIDAEESWIQDPIDEIAWQMSLRFNKDKPIIYNTVQMYRHDRLAFLRDCIGRAAAANIHLGVKLVRGAYMEKERERAKSIGVASPIHANKKAVDVDYDRAIELCVEQRERVGLFLGTHNEESSALLARMIDQAKIKRDDQRFMFSQLYGMGDHLTFNLASAGFNASKYLPYGPVKTVMPYLLRRAKENTSIRGQMGRELQLVTKEMSRRGLKKDPSHR